MNKGSNFDGLECFRTEQQNCANVKKKKKKTRPTFFSKLISILIKKMEKYLVASKPFLESTESKPKPVVKPILKRPPIPKASTSKLAPLNLKKANKNLLKTLHLESNPITHSTAYECTEHVATWASGHESGHSGHGSGWNEMRRVKLLDQGNAKGKASGIFKGVRVYLNGASEYN